MNPVHILLSYNLKTIYAYVYLMIFSLRFANQSFVCRHVTLAPSSVTVVIRTTRLEVLTSVTMKSPTS
jgi:hypothetical protein